MRQFFRGKVRAFALALLILTIVVGGYAYIALTSREEDPFAAHAIINPPFPPLTYSVQTFVWWDTAITAGLHLDWVRLLGFTHAKQTFAWEDLETARGVWDFSLADEIVSLAEARNVELVARLTNAPAWARSGTVTSDFVDAPPDDYADFANYCGILAERYRGRIMAYQVWNEPNLTREWGGAPPDAAAYVDLLQGCSEAIRTADPQAIIISAGLSPTGTHDDNAHRDDIYLQTMYDHGFQAYVDVVGVNAPGWGVPPSYGPDDAERDGRGRWATFRRVEDLRKIMIRNGDAARQMAILEVGYTTDQQNRDYQWHAVDEQTQREYLVAAYEYAAQNWRPWVGLMSAIFLANPVWTPENEEFWWSLNDPQTGRIRPVFAGLAQMPKFCGDAVLPARDDRESAYAPEYNPCD